jgi:hypothetical protein
MLDLALEELHRGEEGWPSSRLPAVVESIERRLRHGDGVHPRRSSGGIRMAAVAASVLSLSLASWFVLGRVGREPQSTISGRRGQATVPTGRIQGVEVARNGTALDPDPGLSVTIDLGTAQGIGPESRFDVVRDSEVLGNLVIRKAEKTWAMGLYRPRQPQGAAARVGDRVRLQISTPAGPQDRREGPAEAELLKLFERLTNSDGKERDRASAALKEMGPAILDRLRDEVARTQDAEVRARLQEVIAYWTKGIAARVGNYIVRWDEVDATLKGIRPSDITPELRRSALLAVVEERMFLNEAARRGIVATEQEMADLSRRQAAIYGSQDAYQEALRLRGKTPEAEREDLRRQLLFSKLHDRILDEARANPSSDPFHLDLKETPREALQRWYDANPEKFAAVDRVDVCYVELRGANEQEKEARKIIADAIVAKSQKKNLGLACAEAGYRENIQIASFDRGSKTPGPFSEATRKLLFDSFGFGEIRAVEEGSSLFVIQLYDRMRRVTESFEQAEPALRAMFENQRRETNRKRMRDGIRERAQITPSDLFKNP